MSELYIMRKRVVKPSRKPDFTINTSSFWWHEMIYYGTTCDVFQIYIKTSENGNICLYIKDIELSIPNNESYFTEVVNQAYLTHIDSQLEKFCLGSEV